MQITLNGNLFDFDGDTLLALLAMQGVVLGQGGIAVSVNDAVVSRGRWAEQGIVAGDRVEIVRAIAGG